MSKSKHYTFSSFKYLLLLPLLALLLLGGLVWGVIALWPVSKPDPEKQPAEAVKFIASKDFGKLKPAERRIYLAALRQSPGANARELFRNPDLSDSERRAAMDNMRGVFQAEQAERMRKFFNSNKDEQNKMLDDEIARMENWRKQREANRNNANNQNAPGAPGAPAGGNRPGQGNGGNRPNPPSAQQRREREAASNPTARAQQQVYRQMMRERREGKR